MSYWHEEKNIIYMAHPATASHSTKEALLKVGFKQYGGHHSDDTRGNPIIFTTVRNHFDALVSWAYKVAPKGIGANIDIDWLVWLFINHKPYFSKHCLWYHYRKFKTHSNVVLLRYERLQEDLDVFLKSVDIEPQKLDWLGKSKRPRDYHSFFEPEAVEFINWLWAEELNELDYWY